MSRVFIIIIDLLVWDVYRTLSEQDFLNKYVTIVWRKGFGDLLTS